MLVFSLAMAAFAVVTTFATPLKPLQHKKIEAGIKDRSLPHLTGRDVNDAALAQLPTCRRDALYQLFTDSDNSAAASAFCSIYIAASSLVRATVTPTYTTTINTVATGAVTTVTTAANETTPTETCYYGNATVLPATGGFVTATGTAGLTPQKRQALPVPPAQADSYPQLRLSSVCSCLVTPATIVTTLTSTASPEYETETVTAQETVNIPQTQSDISVTGTVIPPFQNASTGTFTPVTQTMAPTGIPPLQNTTAELTFTILPVPNNTAEATATISASGIDTAEATATPFPPGNSPTNATVTPFPAGNGSVEATGTIFASGSNTTEATATPFPPANSSINVTVTPFPAGNGSVEATGTISQSPNNTATAGLPGPTGTNASASAAYCNQTFIRGNGTFMARYTVLCAYSYTNLSPNRVESRPSYDACLRECDNDSRCYGYSYLLSGDAENCYIYNYYPLPAGQPDPLFDSGSYIVGTNNGMKR